MPNLYGKQEDEEKQDQNGLPQPGVSASAPAGTPADSASAYQGPESANFTNLENIFSLNKTKAKGLADKATGQVTDALGGLQGRNPPRTGTLRTAEQAAAPFNAAPAQPLRTSQSQVPLAPKKGPLTGQNMTLNQKQQLTLATLPQESAPAQGVARPTNVDVVPQQPAPAPGTSEQALESTETRNGTVTAEDKKPQEGKPTEGPVGDDGVTPLDEWNNLTLQEQSDRIRERALQNYHEEYQSTHLLPGSDPTLGVNTSDEGIGANAAEAQAAEQANFDSLNAALGIQKQNEDYIKAQQQAMLAQEEADKAARAQENADLGRYQKADEMLDSYAADEGQQLLGPGMSALDAELMNQAGGRSAFDDLSKRFQNYDDEFMKQVAGDRGARQMQYEDTQRGLAQAEADRAMLGDQVGREQSGFDSINKKLSPTDKPRDFKSMLEQAKGYTANYTGKTFEQNYTKNPFLHPHNFIRMIQDGDFRQLGGSDIGNIGEKIGQSMGLPDGKTIRYLAYFIESLPPDVRAWVANLTSGAHSEEGGKVLNVFGGAGDEVGKVTSQANSSPEEWQLFQDMFRAYLTDQMGKENF